MDSCLQGKITAMLKIMKFLKNLNGHNFWLRAPIDDFCGHFWSFGIFHVSGTIIVFSSVLRSRVSWALLLTKLVKLLTKRVFCFCSRNEFHETSFLPLLTKRVLTKRVLTKRVFWHCSRNECSRNEFLACAHETSFTKRVFYLCSRNECSRNECSRNEFLSTAHETSAHETSSKLVSK